MNNSDEIYKKLLKEACFALNSKSKNLVYQAYGAAKMAMQLKAITKEEFYWLNTMLIKDGLNNPEAGLE